MSPMIIIVNGSPSSGKTLFEGCCIDYFENKAEILSSIELPKRIYYECGWNGEKTPEARKFLSDLKKFLNENGDWVWKYTERCIENLRKEGVEIFFVDCREPEQIERFVREKGALTVFIDRQATHRDLQSNSSDLWVNNYNYDIYLENNGTIDEWKNQALDFCKKVEEKYLCTK